MNRLKYATICVNVLCFISCLCGEYVLGASKRVSERVSEWASYVCYKTLTHSHFWPHNNTSERNGYRGIGGGNARMWKTKKTTGIIFLKDISVRISCSYLCQLCSGRDRIGRKTNGKSEWTVVVSIRKSHLRTNVHRHSIIKALMIIWNSLSYGITLFGSVQFGLCYCHGYGYCVTVTVTVDIEFDFNLNNYSCHSMEFHHNFPSILQVSLVWWYRGEKYREKERRTAREKYHVLICMLRSSSS